jgi:hypothetical protein
VEVPINVSNCSSSQLYINTIYEDLKQRAKETHSSLNPFICILLIKNVIAVF